MNRTNRGQDLRTDKRTSRRAPSLSALFVCVLLLPGLLRAEETRNLSTKRSSSVRSFGNVAGIIDCNGNGIPDEDDIDNCVADPGCDDCNLNDIPDSCDIASMLSTDADLDGVPDECVFFDGEGGDDAWGTPENWDDDEVPTNLDLIDDESVTIGSAGVSLDLAVEVDTLRLLDGATLVIDGPIDEDFEVEEAGGVLIRSTAAGTSRLQIGNGRRLVLDRGTLEVLSGGILEGAPIVPLETVASAGEDTTAATIDAGALRIASRCGEPIAGEVTLSGDMSTTIRGDLIIDGSEDCAICAFCAPAGSVASAPAIGSVAGGETPPILRNKDRSRLWIGGDLVLVGGVAFSHTSLEPIVLAGSFINRSSCPECFNAAGPILFSQAENTAGGTLLPQVVEFASADLGPDPSSFQANFVISTMEVASAASVEIRDDFPNQNAPLQDALYVGSLILRGGAQLTIDGGTVYCQSMVKEQGSSVALSGGGQLVVLSAGDPIPASSTWGMLVLVLGIATCGTLVLRDTRERHRSTESF